MAGCEITKRVLRYAYPKNGNVHNPTPTYVWIVAYKGRVVGRALKLREAKELAREFMADPEW